MFYVDSDCIVDEEGNVHDETAYQLYSAEMFKTVAQAYPNVLLFPEASDTRYFAYTAPYHELRQDYTGTPAMVTRTYPHALSLIRLPDGDLQKRWQDLIAGVRRGDIMLVHADSEEECAQVLKLYQEAGQQ